MTTEQPQNKTLLSFEASKTSSVKNCRRTFYVKRYNGNVLNRVLCVTYYYSPTNKAICYGACVWRSSENDTTWIRKFTYETSIGRFFKNPVVVILNNAPDVEKLTFYQYRRMEQFITHELVYSFGVSNARSMCEWGVDDIFDSEITQVEKERYERFLRYKKLRILLKEGGFSRGEAMELLTKTK